MNNHVDLETSSLPSQRKAGASVAIITREHHGHLEWLLQWNPKWQAMNLIGGTKETTDVNDLSCVIREIHEELFQKLTEEELTLLQIALSGHNDAYNRLNSIWQDAYIETISRIGATPFECDDFSLSAKCLTHYTFHIYAVTLQADVSLFRYDSWRAPDAQSAVLNEWASAEDIQRGMTGQGWPIGNTVKQIITWFQAEDGLFA